MITSNKFLTTQEYRIYPNVKQWKLINQTLIGKINMTDLQKNFKLVRSAEFSVMSKFTNLMKHGRPVDTKGRQL